ncbi:hypothetical protein AVEN_154874-1 [Araneus ventricosus]|uniref:Cuticle protein 6 n=1 Tax=Araneus ventricosus TaxID=182803 RepID=A0A4Y2A6X9_ARAVE|nr:hypothetical protein AVEN_154874-1 [Araneus ventricosus]
MPFPSSTKPTQPTTMKNVYQAAPLHYVNIGRKLDGDYKFGYDTGKGPSGQSFREEIRLADGTISGTYGVVDELGHKRVVHFSAGKAGLLPQEEPTSKPTKNPSSTFTTPSVGKPYLNTIARHFTSPLASFNLANYLHLKTTAPTSSRSTPTQQNNIAAPRQSTQQNMMAASRQSTPTQQNVIASPRQSISSQQNMIAAVRDYTSAQQKNMIAAPRQSTPTQQNVIAAARQSTSTQQNMIAVPHLYTYGVSTEQQKTLIPFMESYRTGNLQRQAKVEAPSKAQNSQIKDVAYLASTYDPKLEDEYYDSAPPFIDIERLSYNIGTDKNASLKI